MKSFISAIGTATPDYRIEQYRIADFMANAMQLDEDGTRKLQVLYKASGIKYRYSVLQDYEMALGQFIFLPNSDDLEPFPSMQDRMKVYKQEALRLATNASMDCFDRDESITPQQISHLITVSCTGMYNPGLDIELVETLGLPSHTQRTAINYMGCYAALTAIKNADAICKADPTAKVLIVCIELCSLHFQKENNEDNLLANALFGDGAAALIMQPHPTTGFNFSFEESYCDLIFQGRDDMAWGIGDFGFEMKLTTYVPELIRQNIRHLTRKLLKKLGLELDQVSYFAVHPGGKKILQSIETELGIGKEQNRFSYQILRDYGNMSSPTVIFVLKEIWDQLSEQDANKNVLSIAFGPGLTMESMLLRIKQSKL